MKRDITDRSNIVNVASLFLIFKFVKIIVLWKIFLEIFRNLNIKFSNVSFIKKLRICILLMIALFKQIPNKKYPIKEF